MTVQDCLQALEALGNEKLRQQNSKRGASENQFGVKLGDIRKIAKEIKIDHPLALALWETGNTEARLLACLIVEPNKLTVDELTMMVQSETYPQLADWLTSYVIKNYDDKETLRELWMDGDHIMTARAGWSLTSSRIVRKPEGLDLDGLLDRIESEMESAAPEVQWTMNFCLANMGIHFPELRERSIAIGEKLGIFRDYPVSKGCTSPFAPIWINEMVRRQKQ